MRSSSQVKPYFTSDRPSNNFSPVNYSGSDSDSSDDSFPVLQHEQSANGLVDDADQGNSDDTVAYDEEILDLNGMNIDGEDILFQPVPARAKRATKQPAHLKDFVCEGSK